MLASKVGVDDLIYWFILIDKVCIICTYEDGDHTQDEDSIWNKVFEMLFAGMLDDRKGKIKILW